MFSRQSLSLSHQKESSLREAGGQPKCECEESEGKTVFIEIMWM